MLTTLLLSVALPTLLATALISVAHQLWRKSGPMEGARWSLAISPIIGAWSAYIILRRFPEFPPTESVEWALWIALLAAAYGVIESLISLPEPGRLAARALFSLAGPFLVLRPVLEHASGVVIAMVVSAAAIFAGWTALESAAEKLEGSVLPIGLLAFGTMAAGVLGTSGFASGAQILGGATASYGVMMVAGFMRPALRPVRSLAAGTAVLVGVLISAGVFYAETSVLAALMIAAASQIFWIYRLKPMANLRSIPAALVLAGSIALVGGLAVGMGLVSEAPSEESEDDYGYGYD